MCKIFINNVPVFLTTNTTDLPPQTRQCPQLSYRHAKDLFDIIRYIENNSTELKTVFVIGNNQESVQQDFFSHYHLVHSAGGVVFNHNNQVLLINRNNHWDLPKGKMEANETFTETALREVEEETGIGNLSIVSPIMLDHNNANVTYHTYYEKNKRILKITRWYKMLCQQHTPEDLRPQLAEGITQVAWVDQTKVTDAFYLDNSYGSIKDVLLSSIG